MCKLSTLKLFLASLALLPAILYIMLNCSNIKCSNTLLYNNSIYAMYNNINNKQLYSSSVNTSLYNSSTYFMQNNINNKLLLSSSVNDLMYNNSTYNMNKFTNCKLPQFYGANKLIYKTSILDMYYSTNDKPLNYIGVNAILYNYSMNFMNKSINNYIRSNALLYNYSMVNMNNSIKHKKLQFSSPKTFWHYYSTTCMYNCMNSILSNNDLMYNYSTYKSYCYIAPLPTNGQPQDISGQTLPTKSASNPQPHNESQAPSGQLSTANEQPQTLNFSLYLIVLLVTLPIITVALLLIVPRKTASLIAEDISKGKKKINLVMKSHHRDDENL